MIISLMETTTMATIKTTTKTRTTTKVKGGRLNHYRNIPVLLPFRPSVPQLVNIVIIIVVVVIVIIIIIVINT